MFAYGGLSVYLLLANDPKDFPIGSLTGVLYPTRLGSDGGTS